MQGAAWVELLRRIPPDQYDCLMLMTTNGTEIVLQRLIRIECDFLVALGRLAGSTDQGKVLVIPYDQLTYLSLNKKLTDEELQTVLGLSAGTNHASETGVRPVALPHNAPSARTQLQAEVASAAPSIVDKPTAKEADQNEAAGKAPLKPVHKAAHPSKSVLLARLRQRLAEDISKQPKSGTL